MENGLVIRGLEKSIDGYGVIVNGIDLDMAPGEHLSVLGPSGSGKTTLLRLIAGLETPDKGDIRFRGSSMTGVAPHKRNLGMMFQDFALFPHMNVFDNVGFGLKMKGVSGDKINSRVMELLKLTGLLGFEHRYVDDLSGGEKQRVALARTLAPNPDLLLLDEPLSSLDRQLRKRLLNELTAIVSHLNLPTIFVTHDHEEAFAAGERIVIMKQGQIVQQGSRRQLLEHPADEWVAAFLKH